jgi:hypothetical protein
VFFGSCQALGRKVSDWFKLGTAGCLPETVVNEIQTKQFKEAGTWGWSPQV